MAKIDLKMKDLKKAFPKNFTPAQVAKGQTIFLKELAYEAHKYYGGKMMTVPKAGLYSFNWFNVYYSPGVSKISTSIRDDNALSFELSNRANLVAVVSDSTRVLGDGDCTPPGGLGVMEGKAFLIKYLGGLDAIALCVNSYNAKGEHDADKIIEFVKMLQPSVGAVNLEDISQPNCFKVLDTLREECEIPVWHDDAQGTACVTLGGLINALKVAGKQMSKVKMAFFGAGASNTTIVRLILAAGADPDNIVMCDSKGGLHKGRKDLEADKRYYRKWEICEKTNPKRVNNIQDAMKGADVLISLSTPGPGVIKGEWVKTMAKKSIVFCCANPVPEIYPYEAKEAGAYVVATGRGDFPNQVNNSIGFPGILKGATLVKASKITDGMAIAAAKCLAKTAEKRGINPDDIVPKMTEWEVFPSEARDVAMQAIKDGVARVKMTAKEVYNKAYDDIAEARKLTDTLMAKGFIRKPPISMLEKALKKAIAQAK
ncbi:MAG: NADP-dependent malic enzyme [Syntrophales bacterium]|jgi:malate dehydrogenase (oxaloacetate-decarboxylating)|nr:NADP-dependent malic enzyme [Syntrophales bacterium]